MNKPRNIALLLAGGQGQRIHFSSPKQYIEIAGRPILAYTMEAFATHPDVDGFYVVCVRSWNTFVQKWGTAVGNGKFLGVFEAGATGFDSLRNGVKGLAEAGITDETVVLVHDGVRPLVSHRIISDSIETCRRYGSAVAGLWSNEAFMESPDGIMAKGYIPRDRLCLAQTPQTFPLATLRSALAEAAARNISNAQSLYTLMAELGKWPVYISRGETVNIKITHDEDLLMLQALLSGGRNGSPSPVQAE